MKWPDEEALAELDRRVAAAIEGDDRSGVEVLGYGEISCVVRLDTEEGPFACKRLPPFPDRAAFDAYATLVHEYVAALRAAGVGVVDTSVQALDGPGGTVVGYCVQPMSPQRDLVVAVLADAGDPAGRDLVGRLVAATAEAISPSLGLDAQASNWLVHDDGSLGYVDVTTPLMRDLTTGLQLLDTDLFLGSLPWALRGGVRRFLLAEILGHYFDARAALLDLAGNLHKERLSHWLPAVLEEANRRVHPPITAAEALHYYRSDARMWALLQRLRRADRWWQRAVRRRAYPFLLPGRIER